MRGSLDRFSLILLAAVALVIVTPTRNEAQELQLVDYELEDQFGQVHRRADVLGTVVLLIGSDKGGSTFNGQWGKAIQDSLGNHPGYDQISQLPYSDLRGVPFFLKGVIREKFPENPDNWVLMDWKGGLAKAYGFERKNSNILVFARDGSLVHHASGREPEDETLEQVVSTLRRLLD